MEPANVGVRLAASAVAPLVRKLFQKSGPGAELVDRPVRISALVSFRGERRTLGPQEVHRLAERLVNHAVRAAPSRERPVSPDEEPLVAQALADTLSALGELTMDDVQAVRLGQQRFAEELRRHGAATSRELSADAEALYRRLVDTAALHVLNFFTQRSTFVARTLLEQSRQLDRLVKAVDLLVARNPSPLAQDADFEQQYAAYVLRRHSEVTIYGLDLDEAREWPLDTAYLSLEVSVGSDDQPDLPIRAEQAFSGAAQVLLRGVAGSGKTTLVQWLAVSAARQDLTGPMTTLVGQVPFVLPLRTLVRGGELPTPDRFLAAVRCPVAGSQPPGWADRVLAARRGLLLVDGLDEIPESEHEETRRWLRDLLGAFPGNLWLVTSRPSAVREDWLARDGFAELELLPMSRSDVAAFVRRWHRAAEAGEELAEALLATVRGKPELARLATNPLMCGLLCALHRERRGFLPQGRKELYEAGLSMLLGRRDRERSMPLVDSFQLSTEAKTALLQKLAYWLIRNGRSELSRSDALSQLERALQQMPRLRADGATPERVLRYLLVRSGLLREPTAETVDFVHRTFQDYLGARAIVEEGDFPLLIDHAEDTQWEDVIQMAVAHARLAERTRILRGVLEGFPGNGLHVRRLLLAAACLEHATEVDPEVHAEVMSSLSQLIPPNNRRTARFLAEHGGALVVGLLPGPQGLTDGEAEAVVVTATRAGTDAAIPLLARYRDHPSRRVHHQLAWSWQRFDTDLYAEEIIAHLPQDTGLYFSASQPEHLAWLSALGGRSHLQLSEFALVDAMLEHCDPTQVTQLWISELVTPVITDWDWLAAFPRSTELRLTGKELSVETRMQVLKHIEVIEFQPSTDPDLLR